LQVKKEKIRCRTVTGTAGTESAFCELKKYFCSIFQNHDGITERRKQSTLQRKKEKIRSRIVTGTAGTESALKRANSAPESGVKPN
jgi:hypothetical protein